MRPSSPFVSVSLVTYTTENGIYCQFHMERTQQRVVYFVSFTWNVHNRKSCILSVSLGTYTTESRVFCQLHLERTQQKVVCFVSCTWNVHNRESCIVSTILTYTNIINTIRTTQLYVQLIENSCNI